MNMIRALLAGLLLVELCWQQGASAQELPPGSYLTTCQDVELQGDTLVATCLRRDSSPQRTSLPRVQNCVGEIGNLNGALTCNYADSPAPPQPMPAELQARRHPLRVRHGKSAPGGDRRMASHPSRLVVVGALVENDLLRQ